MKSRFSSDKIGICLSVLCMAHCLLTPVVLSIVPVGTALGLWHRGVHQAFLLVIPLIALAAFIPGWRRHRDVRVWVRAGTGLVFLILGTFAVDFIAHGGESSAEHLAEGVTGLQFWLPLFFELVLTATGGVFLLSAHLLNRKLCVCCDYGHSHAPRTPTAVQAAEA